MNIQDPLGADSGARKAAVVLSALGAERAAEVLGHLSDDEIARVAPELARPTPVSPDDQRRVLAEAQATIGRIELQVGGPAFARQALGGALGDAERVDQLIARGAAPEGRFTFLRGVPTQVLVDAVCDEAPRVIALVLVHVPSAQAADVMERLPDDVQGEVALSMGQMDEASAAVLDQVESVVRARVERAMREASPDGRARRLADVLTRVDRTTEERVIDVLHRDAAPMADRVREFMFVFDDLVRASDVVLAQAISQTPPRDLALAIKGASETLRIRLFTVMSEQTAVRVQDELAALGSVRLRDIEEAQERMTVLVRRLDSGAA